MAGGREKGTPNKTTADLKIWINQILNNNQKQFIQDLADLEPQQRVAMLEKLMQYVIPKQQSISIEAQIQAEYQELEQLLKNALEEAIEKIIKRIETLKTIQIENE